MKKQFKFFALYFLTFILTFGLLVGQVQAAPVLTNKTHEQYLIDDAAAADAMIAKARKLYHDGKLKEAQELFRDILKDKQDIAVNVRAALSQELEEINMKLLFSRIETENSVIHEIQFGDTLGKIAKKYNTTIDLIKKANGLKSNRIYAGRKLKVVNGTFKVVVNKKLNTLKVYLNDKLFKTYLVATGKDGCTPAGSFKIVTKLENPTWYNAGAVVPPDSPENILGTRWMGFDERSYGIHGTTMPESIGTNSTAGCVRMLNKDVEELYTLLPIGTQVVVVE